MSREKHLAKIDQVLLDFFNKTSNDLSNKDRIPYSEKLEKSGVFQKFAFDIYRVENDPYGGLWTLEQIDGKPYLVRSSDPKFEEINNGNWTAVSNYDKTNITLAYKKVPVASFSSDTYGYTPTDISSFKSALLETVNQDNSFVKAVLLEQPETKRLDLITSFPEFNKIVRG